MKQSPTHCLNLRLYTILSIMLTLVMLFVILPMKVMAQETLTFSDNFTQDASLNTSLWQINGPLGSLLAPRILKPVAGNANIIKLNPTFSSTGMEIAKVNGKYQIGTIQSTQSFAAPFVAQAVVGGVVSDGSTFIFGLSSANAGAGVVVLGNLNPGDGSYYGINVVKGTGGTWSSAQKLVSTPAVNVFYTIQISVDSSGNAQYSISRGGQVLGRSTAQIGTGPFYVVMAQSEGWPYTVGPNDAIWESVNVASKGPPAVNLTSHTDSTQAVEADSVQSPLIKNQSPSRLFQDNFTSDKSLNSTMWKTQSNLLKRVAMAGEGGNECFSLANRLVQPILSFGPNGMEMAGVIGWQQFTGIQSLQTFSPPFTLKTTVTATVANGNPFELFLLSTDGHEWFSIYGNGSNRNAPYYGIKLGCIPFYKAPAMGEPYTFEISADTNGNISVLLSHNGTMLASKSSHVGNGPFYLVLGQGEGWPNTGGTKNVAIWQSVEVTEETNSAQTTSMGNQKSNIDSIPTSGKLVIIPASNVNQPIGISNNSNGKYPSSQLGPAILSNNLWGLKSSQGEVTMKYLPTSGILTNTISLSQMNRTGGVAGYPEISYGYNPNSRSYSDSSKNTIFPMKLGKLDSLKNKGGFWLVTQYSISPTAPSNPVDFAYDIWITKNSIDTVSSSTVELMVWLYKNHISPAGDYIGQRTIPCRIGDVDLGRLFDIYVNHNNNGSATISFEADTSMDMGVDISVNISAIVSILGDELQQSYKSWYPTIWSQTSLNNFYLSDIELGSEFKGIRSSADYNFIIRDYYFLFPVNINFTGTIQNQGEKIPKKVTTQKTPTIFDNFAQDASLNTSLWQINGPVGNLLAPHILGGNINIIQLNPAFSSTGMEIAQVNGEYQIGTIQSTQPFTAPFVAQAVVGGVVSDGNTFIFGLSAANAGSGVVVLGNLNTDNGSYYGINVETGTRGTWSSAPKLYLTPCINDFYTIQISVDSSGNAQYSISRAGQILGRSRTKIGTGPFYVVMAQSEGWPYTVGANNAIWKSVNVASTGTSVANPTFMPPSNSEGKSGANPVIQSVIPSETSVLVGQTLPVKVTVKNTGGSTGYFDIRLVDLAWLGKWGVFPTWKNQIFNAGQSRTFTFDVKATTTGQHSFLGQACVSGSISENLFWTGVNGKKSPEISAIAPKVILFRIPNSGEGSPLTSKVWVVSKDQLETLENDLVQQLTTKAKKAGVNIKSIDSVTAMVTQSQLVDVKKINEAINLVSKIGAFGKLSTASTVYDASGNALGPIGLYFLDEYVDFNPTKFFTVEQDKLWNQINQTLILAENELNQPLFNASKNNVRVEEERGPAFVIQIKQALEIAMKVYYTSSYQQSISIAPNFYYYFSNSAAQGMAYQDTITQHKQINLSIKFKANSSANN